MKKINLNWIHFSFIFSKKIFNHKPIIKNCINNLKLRKWRINEKICEGLEISKNKWLVNMSLRNSNPKLNRLITWWKLLFAFIDYSIRSLKLNNVLKKVMKNELRIDNLLKFKLFKMSYDHEIFET